MTVPYRRWLSFDSARLEGYSAGTSSPVIPDGWTDIVRRWTCVLGVENPSSDNKNYFWHGVFRPRAGLGFESLEGMDEVVDVLWKVRLHRFFLYSDCDVTDVDLIQGFVNNDNPWHYQRVSGRYYDGENLWDDYPPGQHPGYNNVSVSIISPWLYTSISTVMYSWKTGGGNGVEANRYQDDFFRGGSHFKLNSYVPAFPSDGKKCKAVLYLDYMDVRYFNPVINECRVDDVVQYWVPINTAVEFKLIGMGLNNNDAELDGDGDSRPGGWNDLVDVIEFWKQQDAARDYYKDEFNDAVIGVEWTTHNLDANRTIVESGEVLTIGVAVDTDARWISSVNEAPKVYQDAPSSPFEVIAKMNSFTLNNRIDVGLWIGHYDGVAGDGDHYHVVLRRYDGVGEGMQVQGTAYGDLDNRADSGDLPIWLKIAVDESNSVRFYYSIDGLAWTQLEQFGSPMVLTDWFTPDMQIGLMVSSDSATVHSGCQAPFEYFEVNRGGLPYAILRRTDGDFTVDTNLQITIPSNKFPMLEEGSYILRVIKEGMDFTPRVASTDVWGWAGDWRCTPGGLIFEGERIVIESRIGPVYRYPREKRGSIILIEADKQHKGTLAVSKEWWSEDDVRAPNKFYEGIAMETSAFRRGLDDKIGMFKIADMTLKLSNHKKKFSELLEEYDFKNQLVRLYHAFIDEPESWKTHIVTMIAEDYNIEGTSFEMILKDVSQKYFGIDVPQNVCIKGEEEGQFPNLHENYIGAAMPEILGMASLTTGEYKGAVEAIYVDTVNYRYLAAAGALHSITEVYADNVLVGSSQYEIMIDGSGYTIIDFSGDQGDAAITFNCTGYMYDGWNSVNGYIQNPAWILAYYLTKILSVPFFLLDYATFTALANIYIAMTEEESGKLILQEQRGSVEILRELCFSFGAKCWIAKDGSFAVGRKNLTGISSNTVIFEQTDLLSPVKRKMGMKNFITRVAGRFDYFPFHNVFVGVKKQSRDDLEERYRERREDRIEGRKDRWGGRK